MDGGDSVGYEGGSAGAEAARGQACDVEVGWNGVVMLFGFD